MLKLEYLSKIFILKRWANEIGYILSVGNRKKCLLKVFFKR